MKLKELYEEVSEEVAKEEETKRREHARLNLKSFIIKMNKKKMEIKGLNIELAIMEKHLSSVLENEIGTVVWDY